MAGGNTIDILFANAGGGEFAPLGAITEAHFDKTFNSNVKGLLFTVQKALPLLVDGGSIILTASTTSTVGTPAFSVYSATKAAVRSFARNWILDLKGRNIRVNTLSPGATETPGWDKLASTPAELDQMKSSTIATIPMGRMGTPDEIAKAAVFLASDDSSYVTGIELFVDGGMAQISPLRAVEQGSRLRRAWKRASRPPSHRPNSHMGVTRRHVTPRSGREHVARVACFLAAITARLLRRLLGTREAPFGPSVAPRGKADADGGGATRVGGAVVGTTSAVASAAPPPGAAPTPTRSGWGEPPGCVASPAGPPSGHEATAGPCVGPSRTAAPARRGAERSSGSPGYRAAAPRASAADRSCQSSSGGRCGVAHRGATGPYGSGTPPQQVAPSAEARSRSDGSTRAPRLHGSGGR
jgi:hypothetical protein